MFGLRLITLIVLLIWAFGAYGLTRLDTPVAKGLRVRWPTTLGLVLLVCGFFFQPWVKFGFSDYFIPTPDILGQVIPKEFAYFLAEKIGSDWVDKVVHVAGFDPRLYGWQIQVVPTLTPCDRIVSLLPLAVIFLSAPLAFLGSAQRGGMLPRGLGWVVMAAALPAAACILFDIPNLDQLGVPGHFEWGLAIVMSGAHMGNGPWVCIFGMLLLAYGGLVEQFDKPDS